MTAKRSLLEPRDEANFIDKDAQYDFGPTLCIGLYLAPEII